MAMLSALPQAEFTHSPLFPYHLQTVWQQAAAAWRQKNKPSEFEVKAEEARQAKRTRQEREKAGWNPAAAAAAERAARGGTAAASMGAGFTMPRSSRGGARGPGAAAQGGGRGAERRAQQAPEPVPPARDPIFGSLPEGERRGRYRDYNQQRVAGCRSFADVLCAFRWGSALYFYSLIMLYYHVIASIALSFQMSVCVQVLC